MTVISSQRAPVLILEARFYDDIADQLAAGAVAALSAAGYAHERVGVPGAFELPTALSYAVAGANAPWAGYIALGCVVRGETDHYDHICREVSRALMDLAVSQRIALGFGLLTCATYEQARVRAAPEGRNKGADAAAACLKMIDVRQHLWPQVQSWGR